LMPADIAGLLLKEGIAPKTPLYTLERLSLLGERIREYDLSLLAAEKSEFSDLTMLVFPRKIIGERRKP